MMEVSTRYRLEDLLVVANTRHGPGGHHHARARHDGPDHDHLRDPADARRFLVEHDVEVPSGLADEAVLRRLRDLREAVRRRAERPVSGPDRVPRSGAAYRLDASGRLVSEASGWAGFADDLRLPLIELLRRPVGDDGVKRCGNPLCRWVFVDGSRNRSRRWCDMAACGNRAKVARHRRMARAN